jgi:hypothetical protein
MKQFLSLIIATIIGRLIVDIAKIGFVNTTPSDSAPLSPPLIDRLTRVNPTNFQTKFIAFLRLSAHRNLTCCYNKLGYRLMLTKTGVSLPKVMKRSILKKLNYR